LKNSPELRYNKPLKQTVTRGSTNRVEKMRQPENHIGTIDEARSEWLKARERAAELANKLFQPGSGYGDPEARASDEHLLQSARHDAENLYREYNDIERRKIELKMLDLQRSQRLATWASFVVAAAVGLATIANIVVALL